MIELVIKNIDINIQYMDDMMNGKYTGNNKYTNNNNKNVATGGDTRRR